MYTEVNDSKENIEFRYMMLSRLQMDCKAFLGSSNGGGNEKHLWALNVEEHVQEMKDIFNSLDEKPEWLSLEEIETFEKDMLHRKSLVVTCVGKPCLNIKFVSENEILISDIENHEHNTTIKYIDSDYHKIQVSNKEYYVCFDDTEDFLTVGIYREESYMTELCCSIER